jgi:hypothetical protein
MAEWPSTLPNKMQLGSFAQESELNVIRTDMDVGPAKLRRRVKTGYRVIEGDVILTQDQLLSFISFFENDVKEGSLPFTWIDPIFETVETFRFTKSPSWSPYGQYFRVSLPLEMRVVGTTRPLAASDPWALGMVESTGDIVPTSP